LSSTTTRTFATLSLNYSLTATSMSSPRETASGLQQSRDFEGEIHLLLSDFEMPGMSGADLARAMTVDRPQLEVLLADVRACLRNADAERRMAFSFKAIHEFTAARAGRAPGFSGEKVQGIRATACRLERFHNCCGADWLICGRLAIGLLDSAPQAKRIANPLQDTILPHNICENALMQLWPGFCNRRRFRSSPTYFVPGDKRRHVCRRGPHECARHELVRHCNCEIVYLI
jgi:hypothetical protein